jgi:hypothetical protein
MGRLPVVAGRGFFVMMAGRLPACLCELDRSPKSFTETRTPALQVEKHHDTEESGAKLHYAKAGA